MRDVLENPIGTGILMLILAACLYYFVHGNLKPENELAVYSGVVTDGAQIEKDSSILRYEITVQNAANQKLTFDIDNSLIQENGAKALMGKQVTAKHSGDENKGGDIYVLSSEGKVVISYAAAVKSNDDNNLAIIVIAGIIMVLAAALILFGLIRHYVFGGNNKEENAA